MPGTIVEVNKIKAYSTRKKHWNNPLYNLDYFDEMTNVTTIDQYYTSAILDYYN